MTATAPSPAQPPAPFPAPGSSQATGLALPTRADKLDPHTREVLRAAVARGHRHWMHWRFGDGRLLLRLAIGGAVYSYRSGTLAVIPTATPNGRGRHINGDAFDLVHSKHATKQALAARGFVDTTPEGRCFAPAAIDAAIAYAATLRGPVCVKPDYGKKGINVAPGLTDPASIRAAFARAAAGFGGSAVVVERSLVGEVIRFFYVAPAVVGIKLSRPPSVVGDGVTALAGLIAAKNAERDRRRVVGHKPIVVDADLVAHLALSGRRLASVPAMGERVFVRALSNGAVGADSVACGPGDLHPSYAARVAAICASLPGLRVAALDTIVTDRRAPAGPDTFAILEINNSPGLLPYIYPWEGAPQDVAAALVDLMERLAAGKAT